MPEYLNPEQKKYIDLDTALSRVRGNVTLYCKLLKMYLVSEEFDSFEKNLAAGDYPKACDNIHSIKGLTGNLSLALLFELSAKLNQQLKEGAPNAQDLENYRDAAIKTKEVVTEFLSKASS